MHLQEIRWRQDVRLDMPDEVLAQAGERSDVPALPGKRVTLGRVISIGGLYFARRLMLTARRLV